MQAKPRPTPDNAAVRRSVIQDGRPFPLGATCDGLGVNVALFSANAPMMEVCAIRHALEALGLESFALSTGGKGVHVVAPLARRHDWPTVKAFARALAERFTAGARRALGL